VKETEGISREPNKEDKLIVTLEWIIMNNNFENGHSTTSRKRLGPWALSWWLNPR
jgi:hypothetical protein